MNLKILNELERVIKTSPQVLRDPFKLRQLIQATFNVTVMDTGGTLATLTDKIDEAVLGKYFGEIWQPKTKHFKYSGLKIVDEINKLQPRSVLDLGCGYNEFKGKINNLIGIDPYNNKADLEVGTLQYRTDQKFDVILCLGSVNFGSRDKIIAEVGRCVDLLAEGGTMFFRVNPGVQHDKPEADWIEFYAWNVPFIIELSEMYNLKILDIRDDTNQRKYFVYKKQSTQ